MVLDKPGLYAMPIVYYVCGVRVERICDIKSSNIVIHKKLDYRKFSAIQYVFLQTCNLLTCVGIQQLKLDLRYIQSFYADSRL